MLRITKLESDGIRGSIHGLRNNSLEESPKAAPSMQTSFVQKQQLEKQLPDGTLAFSHQPGVIQLAAVFLGLFLGGRARPREASLRGAWSPPRLCRSRL